jgi:hypothetical protein
MPNDRKRTKRPSNIPALSIIRPSKIYPNWDFWFENIPSGNSVGEDLINLHFSNYSGTKFSEK